ncbi:MAG: PP0621 family protein [Burkholderiaceae bacterium]
MNRILFFLLLAIVIYVMWRSRQRRDKRPSSPAVEEQMPQAMVSCATCGLHVPRQEALLLGDRFFCCEEHRRQPPPA